MKTKSARKNNTTKQPQKSGKSRRHLWILALVALTGIGICGYLYIKEQIEFQSEQTAYEKLGDCIQPLPYEHFLKRYPNSLYYEEVCKRLKEVRQMNHEWDSVCRRNKRSVYTHFMKQHPDSPFYPTCLAKLDSMDWADAIRRNSIGAYNNYLAAHPQGAYTEDARTKREQLQRQTVTPAEQTIIRGLFNNYFSAFSTRDEAALRNTLAFIINNYWNREKVSQDYAAMHMKRLYSKLSIQDINFTTLRNFTIKKQEVDEFRCAYNISFTIDALIRHSNTDKTKHTTYKVVAHVSADHKIDSLVLSKPGQGKDDLLETEKAKAPEQGR